MSDVGHREIKLLIEQVQNGTDDQKAVAAGVLGRLASIHELPVLIASAGGIESLVALARDGSELGKENATAALWALLMAQERQLTVRDEGDHGENVEESTVQLLDLEISGLDGHVFHVSVFEGMKGRELVHLVQEQVPKRGCALSLWFGSQPILRGKTLKEQGLVPNALVSYIYTRPNCAAVWKAFSYDLQSPDTEQALEGMTRLSWQAPVSALELLKMPKDLETITFQ